MKPKPHRKLYASSRWQKIRKIVLTREPVCSFCKSKPATVVDHIVPHRGDQKLFYHIGNLQPLCKLCHDSDKQRIEKGRPKLRVDDSGWPEIVKLEEEIWKDADPKNVVINQYKLSCIKSLEWLKRYGAGGDHL